MASEYERQIRELIQQIVSEHDPNALKELSLKLEKLLKLEDKTPKKSTLSQIARPTRD
jgi:hypothetical protein